MAQAAECVRLGRLAAGTRLTETQAARTAIRTHPTNGHDGVVAATGLSFSLVSGTGAPDVGKEWINGYAACSLRFLPAATVVTRRRVRAITKAERGPETQSANVELSRLKCGTHPVGCQKSASGCDLAICA
jgi:hypothetical protein